VIRVVGSGGRECEGIRGGLRGWLLYKKRVRLQADNAGMGAAAEGAKHPCPPSSRRAVYNELCP
jgi:hypothetical protein